MGRIIPSHGDYMVIWLVVFGPTSLKNDGVKVSWDDEIPKYDGKVIIQPCSKPPTRYVFYSVKIQRLLSCFRYQYVFAMISLEIHGFLWIS